MRPITPESLEVVFDPERSLPMARKPPAIKASTGDRLRR
jgi:hypothetical protein